MQTLYGINQVDQIQDNQIASYFIKGFSKSGRALALDSKW